MPFRNNGRAAAHVAYGVFKNSPLHRARQPVGARNICYIASATRPCLVAVVIIAGMFLMRGKARVGRASDTAIQVRICRQRQTG
jgi:hypothetical protein